MERGALAGERHAKREGRGRRGRSVRDGGVIERLKEGFDHAVELVDSDFFVCCVFLQLNPWLLPPCSCF